MARQKVPSIEIDLGKFKEAIKERGLSQAKLSIELGREQSYIAYFISQNGSIPEFVAKYLQKVYEIKPEEYSLIAKKDEPISVDTEEVVRAVKAVIDSYAWQESVSKMVRFVLREEPFEDQLRILLTDIVRDTVGEIVRSELKEALK